MVAHSCCLLKKTTQDPELYNTQLFKVTKSAGLQHSIIQACQEC